MYTVEMNFDETVVTVMDESGAVEDIKVYLGDDAVYITQYSENTDRDEMIQMPIEMWREFFAALNSPNGTYQIKT